MILLDTTPLVALVDERDRLHAKAKRDLNKLRSSFCVTSVVLSECCFLLQENYLRARLYALIEKLNVTDVEPAAPWRADVFDWLEQYADHEPDFADAVLVVLASRHPNMSIWSYDSEFRKVWRGLDGKPLRIVPASRRG